MKKGTIFLLCLLVYGMAYFVVGMVVANTAIKHTESGDRECDIKFTLPLPTLECE